MQFNKSLAKNGTIEYATNNNAEIVMFLVKCAKYVLWLI